MRIFKPWEEESQVFKGHGTVGLESKLGLEWVGNQYRFCPENIRLGMTLIDRKVRVGMSGWISEWKGKSREQEPAE